MTDAPQLYLRRCNGLPIDGITITRDTVESVLVLARAAQGVTAVDIHGDLDTGLTIRIPAGRPWEVELSGTAARTFTYEPLPAGQRRTNVNSTTATATETGPTRAMMEGEA